MIGTIEESYTIQQVAEMTGISAHTLRYYERIGLLEPIGRHDSSGHRRYLESDLGWIHFVVLLRNTGMPIQQMQRFMDLARQGDDTIADRVEVLTEHSRELSEHIAMLQGHLDHLNRKIGFYTSLLTQTDAEMCD